MIMKFRYLPSQIADRLQATITTIVIIACVVLQILSCSKPNEPGSGSWMVMDSGTSEDLVAVWGTSPSDLFAVGVDGIFHFDGANWIRQTTDADGSFSDISGSSQSDVYAVGSQGLFHYDGVIWTECCFLDSVSLGLIWAAASFDVYGIAGLAVWHYDGINWNVVDSLPVVVKSLNGVKELLHPVMRDKTTTLWVVGNTGMFRSYNKLPWSREQSGMLVDVWGRTWNDVYLVGPYGRISHYDGANWQRQNTEKKDALKGICGNANGEVFAVGLSGTIMRKDRESWHAMESGTSNTLYDVWVSPEGEAFAVGRFGTIVRYQPD